jgi:hypothetical protein
MIDPRKIRPLDSRGLPSTKDSVLAHRLVDEPPRKPLPWEAVLSILLFLGLMAGVVAAVWYGYGLLVVLFTLMFIALAAREANGKKG